MIAELLMIKKKSMQDRCTYVQGYILTERLMAVSEVGLTS